MSAAVDENARAKFEHTEKIGNRRKALFPTNDQDSDLGHMSPISSDHSTSFDANIVESEADRKFRRFFNCNLEDYIILDRESDQHCTPDPCSETSLSSLYLSPIQKFPSNTDLRSPREQTKVSTPLGKSPSSSLQTPHDTSTVKLNQKLTKRKLPLDDDGDQLCVMKSPDSKHAKVEPKSKVRTALFPDSEIVLSVQSFYPKTTTVTAPKVMPLRKSCFAAPKSRPAKRQAPRKRLGEINAGVSHKIRKPKQKKATQVKITKVAKKIIEKSPLTEYLEEMTTLKKSLKPIKPIEPPPAKPQDKPIKENAENLSPNVEPITTRKFFKSLRSHSKLNAQKQKESVEETSPNASIVKAFDSSLDSENSSLDVTSIIDRLSDKSETSKSPDANLIFSPTSQMCDMASALDLNSPKRAKLNISKMLDEGTYQKRVSPSSAAKLEKAAKFYSLFQASDKTIGSNPSSRKRESSGSSQASKKIRLTADNQLLLDAGQKKFGAIECFECNFLYETGDANDELIHKQYHDAINTFKYNGWKNERVVKQVDYETRIVKVIPGDSKVWWRKARELLDFINRELGFFDCQMNIDKSQIYFYVKNKKIIGCVVAEVQTAAHKLLCSDVEDVDLCSEESYKIHCGVSRVWVAQHHRRKGIATELLETLRRNFQHGGMLNLHDIAFSTPTAMGKKFGTKYFGTNQFLIYMN